MESAGGCCSHCLVQKSLVVLCQGTATNAEESQMLLEIRWDDRVVWRSCQEAFCGQAEHLSSSYPSLGCQRHRASQPGSPLPLHILISPQWLGQCSERWLTCSQMRSLAIWWAMLGEEPQGQAQAL